MMKPRWLLALPLALAATIGSARASAVRDGAGLFSPDAVKKAEAELNRVERESGVTTTIETIESLKGGSIDEVSLEHAKQSRTNGLYLLISKEPHKIYARATRQYGRVLNATREKAIYQAFGTEFAQGDFDAGLLAGVQKIDDTVLTAAANGDLPRHAAGVPVAAGRNVPNRRGGGGGFGLGSLLGLGLIVLVVLFVLRLLGSLFNRSGGGYAGGGPGRMGGPGYGPGYGGGGGGGGMMSSIFGGLGGALAGNWLYDQMSGRHGGGYVDNSAAGGQAPADTGAGDWDGGTGAGGDWGGGGGGGGGDWGGGGGGGGGGDW